MTEAVTNCRAIIKFKENDRQAACAPNPVHAVAFQDVTMNFFLPCGYADVAQLNQLQR